MMNLLNGTAYILWIDTETPLTSDRGLNYRPVVCGISNGFSMDVESVSTRNKCDGGYDQSKGGYLSWGFDMDGHAIGLKMADKLLKANFDEISRLALNKTEFWCKQQDIESSVTREGRVRISQYRETASMEEPYSFTANFVGIGKPILDTNIFTTVLAVNSEKTQLIQDGNENLLKI